MLFLWHVSNTSCVQTHSPLSLSLSLLVFSPHTFTFLFSHIPSILLASISLSLFFVWNGLCLSFSYIVAYTIYYMSLPITMVHLAYTIIITISHSLYTCSLQSQYWNFLMNLKNKPKIYAVPVCGFMCIHSTEACLLTVLI